MKNLRALMHSDVYSNDSALVFTLYSNIASPLTDAFARSHSTVDLLKNAPSPSTASDLAGE